MKSFALLLSISSIGMTAPALAQGNAAGNGQADRHDAAPGKAFTTGVAKGRDMFDTAISASTLDDVDVQKISALSVAEIIGNVPGIRAEGSGTDGFSAISIRGLPLAADGSKFLQLQEDGLPVLEFGDIRYASSDMFLRADLTLSQVQAIRGGSASTFASNSPGGVVNFLSKTGETEGGAVQATAGLDHDRYRLDFDYGGRVGDGWRFNVGGFYREGEGPRATGFTGFRGGQVKANVTRELAGGGYIRLYGKYLNDRQPVYATFPITVTGTDASPTYRNIPGVDIRRDLTIGRFNSSYPMLDGDNRRTTADMRNGILAISKAVGLETQFDVGGWSITNRFRFSANSGEYNELPPVLTGSVDDVANALAEPGATIAYASGPNAGRAIGNPGSLNGNGLLNYAFAVNTKLNNLNNTTNDLRASRVWDVGRGKLTTTGGVYYSSQNIDTTWSVITTIQDVAPNGQTALVDLFNTDGEAVTQNGVASFGKAWLPDFRRRYDVNYRILAPYASANYKIGALAIGASVRVDTGRVNGRLFGADLGGNRRPYTAIDMNGDGRIEALELSVAALPLLEPGDVDYSYDYLSYSVSANYRIADALSTFARYSRGARATADRLLFPPTYDPASGTLTDPKNVFGSVKQAEVGAKFRTDTLAVYVTGFWAATEDHNLQVSSTRVGETIVLPIDRSYSAKGIELESQWRAGPFSLNLGATYTHARIDKDADDATLKGKRPRHQAAFFFTTRPELDLGALVMGTQVNGTTSSFTQDVNQLRQPGYVIFSPYVQYRLSARAQLSVNAFNVFDKIALISVGAPTIPESGITTAQALNGRTVSASLRFDL